MTNVDADRNDFGHTMAESRAIAHNVTESFARDSDRLDYAREVSTSEALRKRAVPVHTNGHSTANIWGFGL